MTFELDVFICKGLQYSFWFMGFFCWGDFYGNLYFINLLQSVGLATSFAREHVLCDIVFQLEDGRNCTPLKFFRILIHPLFVAAPVNRGYLVELNKKARKAMLPARTSSESRPADDSGKTTFSWSFSALPPCGVDIAGAGNFGRYCKALRLRTIIWSMTNKWIVVLICFSVLV